MRALLTAAGALLVMGNVSFAQTMMIGTTWNDYGIIKIGKDEATITGCDSNERTPAESVECKLAYWKRQIEMLQRERTALDAKLEKAQERVQAFGDVKRR